MQKPDDFGVWVELKMRKQENGEVEKRVCHICRKAFSSGKALGGHMRSHVTKKMKLNQDIGFKNIQAKCSSKCVVCGRKFPSMKSLFGHMRSHPERQWRGINPPPSTPAKNIAFSFSSSSSSSSPSSSVSDGGKDRAVDLTESLIRGWAVTAKRGRKATAAERSDDEADDAVNFLMLLAKGEREEYGDKVKKGLMIKKRKKKVKLCDLNSMANDSNNNNIPTSGKLLDFDLNEIPRS